MQADISKQLLDFKRLEPEGPFLLGWGVYEPEPSRLPPQGQPFTMASSEGPDEQPPPPLQPPLRGI